MKQFERTATAGTRRMMKRLSASFTWKGKSYACAKGSNSLGMAIAGGGGGIVEAGNLTLTVMKDLFTGGKYPDVGSVIRYGNKERSVTGVTGEDDPDDPALQITSEADK